MNEPVPVVEEAVVRLRAQDELLYEWRCTPTDLTALALGRLYADGRIADATIASRIEIARSGDEYDMLLNAQLAAGNVVRARVPRISIPEADEFAELFRALFARVDERHENGGMHAAALARNGGIQYQAEDVGRHNAVDKAIGLALLDKADIPAHGMLVSARVSGEIARKAARSAIAWLASRSIPTTLAVRTAQIMGMPIIGRAAGRNAHVYR